MFRAMHTDTNGCEPLRRRCASLYRKVAKPKSVGFIRKFKTPLLIIGFCGLQIAHMVVFGFANCMSFHRFFTAKKVQNARFIADLTDFIIRHDGS